MPCRTGCGRKISPGYLCRALQRLDRLLEQAVIAAAAAYGAGSAADRFRGMHISTGDVERLLARPPGAPLLWVEPDGADAEAEQAESESRLAWLAEVFGLSPFDVDAILIALAPEIDLRYERLYAFLQDDVSKKRPPVDLVLNLLCPTAEARLAQRASFGPEAPLIRHRLIRLIPDPVRSSRRSSHIISSSTIRSCACCWTSRALIGGYSRFASLSSRRSIWIRWRLLQT